MTRPILPPNMDTQRVKQELHDFLTAEAAYMKHWSDSQSNPGSRRGPGPVSNSDLEGRAQIVEQILDVVVPRWRGSGHASSYDPWHWHTTGCARAIAEIDRQQDLREMLGDLSPSIQAAALHPWVWESARSLWQSNYFREAVRAASVKVNAETQRKIGRRDVTETALFNQAFSDDEPNAGMPRLRHPGDDNGKTAKSLRRGTRSFAEGCYAAIRNPLSHDEDEEPSEHEALEQLAAFSILSRWVDAAELRSM